MPPYCSHGGDVPQFDGTIKAACCQDVSVVRTELAVKYSLYVALCQNTDQVSQTQIIKQLLHLMYVESTVHLLELPCYITVSLPLCITTQCPLCWDQCPDTHLIPEEIPLPSTQIIQANTSIQECAYNLSGWKNKV